MEREACALWHGATVRPGVELAEDGGYVAVFSAHAETIWFCQFDESGRETRWRLGGRSGDMRHGFVPGLKAGAHYGLRADGPWDREHGHWFDPGKLLIDPYTTRISAPFVYDPSLAAPREAGIDTASLMPRCIVEASYEPSPRLEGVVPRLIYEVTVKAFSKLHPGVPAQLRGTIAALAEPACIEHMVRLGVSHVELMPIVAWMDERHLPPLGLSNAWGYNPVTMMALDPRLAPGGFEELRRTVAALHDAGIAVLLDVVFNHTAESDAFGPTVSLRGLDSLSYYRHYDGILANDTGCGNTLACDSAPVHRLVVDTMTHFVRNAGIDGFRFDLATVLGRSAHGFSRDAPLLRAMIECPELAGIELIAEPWDIGPGGYHVGNFPWPFREWNDRYRDDVRKFWRGEFGAIGGLATRLAGSADLYPPQRGGPSTGINFIAAHDGFALRDIVSYAYKHNEDNGESNRDGTNDNHSWDNGIEGETSDKTVIAARCRDLRALLATLFVSRGLPMLTAGDECGRTQGGNNNAYAQDNATTWLDWAGADETLATFAGALARLRQALPALCADVFLTGEPRDAPDVQWLRRDGATMSDADWRDDDVLTLTLTQGSSTIWLGFNRGHGAAPLVLPRLTDERLWCLCLDSEAGFADCASLHPRRLSDDDRTEIAPRTVLAFVARTPGCEGGSAQG